MSRKSEKKSKKKTDVPSVDIEEASPPVLDWTSWNRTNLSRTKETFDVILDSCSIQESIPETFESQKQLNEWIHSIADTIKYNMSSDAQLVLGERDLKRFMI